MTPSTPAIEPQPNRTVRVMICLDNSADLLMTTPLGTLRLSASPSGRALSRLLLVDEHTPAAAPAELHSPERRHSAVLDDAAEQIAHYIVSMESRFSVPVLLPESASAADRAVWEYVRTVQPGHAVGAARVAKQLGISRALVQRALAQNPVPIIIPTHRVLGTGGRVIPAIERAPGSLTRQLHAHERIPSLP